METRWTKFRTHAIPFNRMIFFSFYLLELLRLFYATSPCVHRSAVPFFVMFGLGMVLGGVQIAQPRLPTLYDTWQIFYSLCVALTFYFWGSLRGSTLGALKGALGLTATSKGSLPVATSTEISCFAAHWSMTSFVRMESRAAAFFLIAFCTFSGVLFWLRLKPAQVKV